MTTKTQQHRADILVAYACRAIFGLRAQKERLVGSEYPAPHDLDFYAHAAWQLREAGCRARDRLELDEARRLLADLDATIPRLTEYRNVMGHAIDDRLNDVAWFGLFVAQLIPGGPVEYVLDVRDEHHEALERFFDGLVGALEPLCSDGVSERIEHARQSRDAKPETATDPLA